MANKSLKLYRGISASEFNLASGSLFRENKRSWEAILQRRVRGRFDYPSDLDKMIQSLHKNLRLEYQYFTDSKRIADGYARKVGGILVELTVPLGDVVSKFDLEFQNFGRRKKNFEIVYCIRGSVLAKHHKRWRLNIRKKK